MADLGLSAPRPSRAAFVQRVEDEVLEANMRAYAILGVRPPRAVALGYGEWIMERSVASPPAPGMCCGTIKAGREHGLLLRCANSARPGESYCARHP